MSKKISREKIVLFHCSVFFFTFDTAKQLLYGRALQGHMCEKKPKKNMIGWAETRARWIGGREGGGIWGL